MGIIRFFLSLCVVVYHLTAKVPDIGILAVCGFYIISGFLMTLVLNETYRFDLKSFAINRALRLYPSYFIAAAVGLFVIASFSNSATYHMSWGGTTRIGSFVGNAFMFPWAFLSDATVTALPPALTRDGFYFRIIPSTWSVGVELCCYFLMWLIGSRGIKGATILFGASVLWHIYFKDSGVMRYVPVPAAALPFALGAFAYFIARRWPLESLPLRLAVPITVFLFLFNWYWMASHASGAFTSIQYYTNMLFVFCCIIAVNRKLFDGWVASVDKLLGAMAYPMFLIHWICGLVAWNVLGSPPDLRHSWQVFWVAVPMIFGISYGLARFIDEPIEKMRRAIRDGRNSGLIREIKAADILQPES